MLKNSFDELLERDGAVCINNTNLPFPPGERIN